MTKDIKRILQSVLRIGGFFAIAIFAYNTSFNSSTAYFSASLTTPPSGAETGDWVAPPVPTLLSPANNTIRNTNGMVMDWTDVTDDGDLHNPVYYIYQSSHLIDFSTLAYQSGHLSSSNIPAPGTPDGVYYWRVKACDSIDNCSDWTAPWKVTVDNIAPYVKIDSPLDGQAVSGTVSINGTVTDNNPHHYWLVVQRPDGTTVAGPGVVNNSSSFTNQLLFTWNTSLLVDGQYIIKLEARDAANNKDPNLAPVPADPESPTDSVDWITIIVNNTPPTSNITSTESTQNTKKFTINYEAEDNIDFVQLCYVYNLGSWVCDPKYQDTPASPGSFDFDSPQGDGIYWFQTIAHDKSGNVESKDLNIDFYSVEVDSTPPTTNLNNTKTFGTKATFRGQNLLKNGNFENGDLSWSTAGTGDHHLVSQGENLSGGTVPAKVGNNMFEIGFKNAPLSSNATDAVYQILAVPAKLSSNLSFWFRGFSEDTADYDQFKVEIRDENDFAYENLLLTGSDELGSGNNWNGDSGWRNISHSLTAYAGKLIKLWFEVTNNDVAPAARTWAYVDDVKIETLNTRVGETVIALLDTHDVGSGVDSTSTLPPTNVGENEGGYSSTDTLGNTEATQSSSIIVLPNVVLNKIAFHTSSEFIEIYNNTSSSVDVAGWTINNGSQNLTISIANVGSSNTVIASHTPLVVNIGDTSIFNLNDAGGTVNLKIGDSIVDTTAYLSQNVIDEVWQRGPDGLGTWALSVPSTPSLDVNLVSRLSVSKITMTVFNVPSSFGANPADTLEYAVTYTNSAGPQQFGGQLSSDAIENGKADRDFYLGTCSTGGACVAETGIGSSFVVDLTGQVAGSSINITKVFTLN